jgi:hypothetical protein
MIDLFLCKTTVSNAYFAGPVMFTILYFAMTIAVHEGNAATGMAWPYPFIDLLNGPGPGGPIFTYWRICLGFVCGFFRVLFLHPISDKSKGS